MKTLVALLLGLAFGCAHGQTVYNAFSPGGALFGTWNSQSVDLTQTAFLTGPLGVSLGGTGVATLTGLVLGNGANAFSAYTGTSCTNQFPRSLNLNGVATCATVSNTDLANSSITINGTATALGGTRTLTLASADFVNQGTTTTVLHGNAAGNPAFAAVSLTADVSGVLPAGNGGASFANPSGLIGLTAVNGVATTADRSDSTHALNQSIAPTWTGLHVFSPASGAAAGITVNGAANADSVAVLGSSTSGQSFGIDILAGTNSSDYAFRAQNQGNTLTLLKVTGAGAILMPQLASSSAPTTGTVCWTTGGNLTVDTTLACLSSTRRIKEHITPIDIGLREVMQLTPVDYDLKPEFNPKHLGPQVGLIAEDVREIDPRLVGLDAKGDVEGVRYMQLTALLVRAIQEQQVEIIALQKQLTHLQP